MTLPARRADYWLAVLLVLGLVLRVLFVLFGAKVYYGTQQAAYVSGDTQSYVYSFHNWWVYGRYTFDFLEPEASYGRLPGYPLFYGLHEILFGPEGALPAVAITQLLLDTAAIGLVWQIARIIMPASRWAPRVVAGLYAVYPFSIVWLPNVATESLSTTLSVAWLWLLLRRPGGRWHPMLMGALLVVIFFVREVLGFLVPLTGLYWLVLARRKSAADWVAALRPGVLMGLTFLIGYVWWPVRNYIVSGGEVVLVKPLTAGYACYKPDINAFRWWVMRWSTDFNVYLDSVAYTGRATLPPGILADAADEARFRRGARLAYESGSSYYLWRTKIYGTSIYRDTARMRRLPILWHNRNEEIAAEFTALDDSYKRHHPVAYYLDVPLQNVGKALFKSKTAPPGKGARVAAHMAKSSVKDKLVTVLFGLRSALVLLGFAGLVVLRRNRALWPVAWFVGFSWFFFCFLLRQLEMRYLLQSDVLLLIPAGLLVSRWLDKRLPGEAQPAPLAGQPASVHSVA